MSDPFAQGPDPWSEPHQDFQPWPAEPNSLDAGRDPSAPPPPAEYIECWRCGKMGFRHLEVCIYCRAVLTRDTASRKRPLRVRTGADASPLVKVVLLFIGLLLLSLILGLFLRFSMDPASFTGHEGAKRLLKLELVFELIASGMVLLGLVWVGLPPALPSRSAPVRVVAWSVAAPALLLLLALNYGYHHLLRDFLRLPAGQPDLVPHKDLLALTLVTICLQPAVIEELFFRYLALGTLRRATSTHGAVLISSVMFGMAHIYQPLGIPYLIVLGMALGYLRVASGSLVLPMVLHFGHNLAVLFIK